MDPSSDHLDHETLRVLVQRFVRGFGLLDDSQTPCGQPLKTSTAHALMILLQAPAEGLHQAALSRQLGIDKSNVSRLIKQLVDQGRVLIAASTDEDARLKRVRLSAKGRRLAAQVNDASQQRFAELCARMSVTRRRTAIAGLRALLGALEPAEQRKQP